MLARDRLRIALVSTPFVSVPPKGYGGTELVVAELALALRARGVEVVLYATGDSHLPGIEVRSCFSRAHWPPDRVTERMHAAFALRDIEADPRGFDVVHAHTPSAVELSRLVSAPMVCTLHHERDPLLSAVYRAAPGVALVGISRVQAEKERCRVDAVVHHGLDPNRFLSLPDQGYLLFLGRYDRVKGVTQAIEVAQRSGVPLVMAGEPHQREYFDEEVRPLIQKYGVLEVGPVGGERKAALIARARALIFPVQWDEPFGLVMIEAMLSGVPVLATARGAAPEVIEDGVTGVLCDDPAELVAAARIADRLFDRATIRRRARERWSSSRMAADYLQVYRAVCARRALGIALHDTAAGA